MVVLLTSVRNSPCFGGLRRTKTCHWQLFARPSTCFLCYFLHAAKSNNPFPFAGKFRGFANLESAHRKDGFAQAASRHLPGRRGAAPYLYTQSVYAACFASILRRQSRSMAFPFGNISPTFKKVGQNKGHSPLPVHAKRVQMRPRFA